MFSLINNEVILPDVFRSNDHPDVFAFAHDGDMLHDSDDQEVDFQ